MTTSQIAKTIRIPAAAVVQPLNKQWAAVALTRREVETLLVADGYRADSVRETLRDWDNGKDYSTGLNSTGAKVGPMSRNTHKRLGLSRARTFLLSGYHYAGTDVASLVIVSA